MDLQVLQSRIAWRLVEEVDLQGGEVLALPQARDFYRWACASTQASINLITNGTLLDADWAGLLVRGSDWVEISVNAATRETHELVNRGSRFDRVVANVKMLVEAKRRARSATRVIYKFTIIPENLREIPDAIALADTLGCDEIAFGYSGAVPEWLRREKETKEAVRERIAEAASAAKNVKVNRQRLRTLDLVPE